MKNFPKYSEEMKEKLMIKDLAWNTFKKTGNINSYLEFVETENIEKQIEQNLLITEQKNIINNGVNNGNNKN